ncbi:MAG: C39 family peptidase [Verrucomicrobiota bacterium]
MLSCLLAFSLAASDAAPESGAGLPFKLGVEAPTPEGVAAVRRLSKSQPFFLLPVADPVLSVFQTTVLGAHTWQEISSRRLGKLPPSGGDFFAEPVVMGVPHFFQHDARWAADPLGGGPTSLGSEGCAVACAAMLLNFYGAETDPQRLNRFLIGHERGYTGNGWLWWEDAAELAGGAIVHAYESDPSYHLIDANLREGNPVIVRVTFPNGVTHFVVVLGKEGFEYLVNDPGTGGRKGVYPLSEIGLPIDGLRFYVRTGAPVRQPEETLLPMEVPPEAEPAADPMPQKPLAPESMPEEAVLAPPGADAS